MIKRFYTWLRLRFLPEWARRQLMEENQKAGAATGGTAAGKPAAGKLH